jgi:hypothetical protein
VDEQGSPFGLERASCWRIGLPVSAKEAAVWYKEHRGEFVAVAKLARSGALGDPSGWDYYGPRLPECRSTSAIPNPTPKPL